MCDIVLKTHAGKVFAYFEFKQEKKWQPDHQCSNLKLISELQVSVTEKI